MRNYFLFFLLSVFFISCNDESGNVIDTSAIQVDLKVDRFDVDFYDFKGRDLESLKKKYSFLFPKNTPDSVWIAKIKDKEEQELYIETQKIYKDFSNVEKELTKLFKHIIYYNPEFQAPNIITVLSNIDYEYRIVYADILLFISLDVYLGKEHSFYNDYPNYIKENNIPQRIVIDVANKIIDGQIEVSNNRSFLHKMITEGKRLYLLDLYAPWKPDDLKIGYSKDKMEWTKTNEEQVWKYFIENSILYSTDTKLNKRFLDDAPFSKFYLAEDTNSPGRIGQWLGWQIVRSFMEKNDVSLQTLLSMDEEEIFKKSNYKPRK